MSVTTATNKSVMLGDGVLGAPGTPFTFTFNNGYSSQQSSPATALSYLYVIYTDADGVETEVTQGTGPTQCLITLNAATGTNLWGAGGSIVYQRSASPILAGTTLTVYRELPLTQLVSLQNQASYGQYATSAERSVDMTVLELQQVSEAQGRAISVPIVDEDPPEPLPPAAQRANLWMAFDGDGNPIAASAPSGSTAISSAMEPVVTAATLALGRTAFGLGDMAVEDIGLGLEDDGAGAVRVNGDTVQDAINRSVDSSYHTTQRAATGPIVYTLPRANTLWNGFQFTGFTFSGAITFAVNAADSIGTMVAGTSLTIQPGCFFRITTDAAASGVWYVDVHKLSSAFGPGVGMLNGYLAETRAGGAATIALKTLNGTDPSSLDPVYFVFRSATVGSGVMVIRVVTTALSITIPSTATMGFSNASPGQLWAMAIDNAGTVELALVNARNGINIYRLQGWGIVSTTAMTTGSDSAAVPYSTSARSSVAYAALGFLSWQDGLTVAGTWDAAPTRIQLAGYGVPLPGETVQVQQNFTGALATGAVVIPYDDTIPQQSVPEGTSFMTQAVTPTSKANLLHIEFKAYAGCSGAADLIGALYQDSTSAAIAAYAASIATAAASVEISGEWVMLSATASATTFKLFLGPNSAATVSFNGSAGARIFGGAYASFLRVTEIMA